MKFRTWIGMAMTLVSTLALSAPVVLTQSSSQAISPYPFTPVCFFSGAVHSYWRAYDLAPLNLPAPLVISSVQFGIQDAIGSTGGSQPATVNVYTSAGAFPGGVLTLRATQTVSVPDQSGTLFTVNLTTPTPPLPVDSIVVIELSHELHPSSDLRPLMGANGGGESAPGYISVPVCGIPTPVTLASVGFGDVHIVLNAIGTTGPVTLEENLASAYNGINSLMPPAIIGPAQKAQLLNLLGLVSRYKDTPYRSLALASLNSVILRVDGCALRATPDTVLTHGGAGMDFVTTCPAQGPIYTSLKAAQAQLTGP